VSRGRGPPDQDAPTPSGTSRLSGCQP
jgi:hypothetical protein